MSVSIKRLYSNKNNAFEGIAIIFRWKHQFKRKKPWRAHQLYRIGINANAVLRKKLVLHGFFSILTNNSVKRHNFFTFSLSLFVISFAGAVFGVQSISALRIQFIQMPFQAFYIKNNGAKVQEIHANTHSQHIRFEDEIKQKHTRKRKILCCVVLKMRINFKLFVLLSFWARFALDHWEHKMWRKKKRRNNNEEILFFIFRRWLLPCKS